MAEEEGGLKSRSEADSTRPIPTDEEVRRRLQELDKEDPAPTLKKSAIEPPVKPVSQPARLAEEATPAQVFAEARFHRVMDIVSATVCGGFGYFLYSQHIETPAYMLFGVVCYNMLTGQKKPIAALLGKIAKVLGEE